jgi:hypothetical protein
MVGRAPVLSCFAIRDVLGVLGSRRGDHANRCIFPIRLLWPYAFGRRTPRPYQRNGVVRIAYFVVADWCSHDDQPPSPSLNPS